MSKYVSIQEKAYKLSECIDYYEISNRAEGKSPKTVKWEPSEYRASMIRPIIIRMGRIMIEFMDWISEPTCESK